jgi:hypothetical protein
MIKITEIRRTCFACPAQWEGKCELGCVYIRFRWGHLRVGLGPTVNDAVAADPIFEWDHSDDLSGHMEYDELKRITAGVLNFPEREDTEDPEVQGTIKS